jgi:hypothetical protein
VVLVVLQYYASLMGELVPLSAIPCHSVDHKRCSHTTKETSVVHTTHIPCVSSQQTVWGSMSEFHLAYHLLLHIASHTASTGVGRGAGGCDLQGGERVRASLKQCVSGQPRSWLLSW